MRPAAEIGAGLAPARPPRLIAPGERIHVIGIAGSGASAAAILAQAAGAIVTGCDPGGPSPYTPAVLAAGIPISWAHDRTHITHRPRPDRVAVTKALTAVEPHHPELVAVRHIGLVPEPWHQAVSDAAAGRTLIAVAGTHGKSTTAGWLVHVLAAAGQDPSAFVGALLPAHGGQPAATARIGRGSAFVVEADEYAGNFDPYLPDIAVVTNVDWDHPDVFASIDDTLDAFAGWLRRAVAAHPRPPALVINVGDPGGAQLAARVADWPGAVIRIAVAPAGEASAGTASAGTAGITARILDASPSGTLVEFHGPALGDPLRVQLPTAGRHNVANAAVVAAAALAMHVAPADVARGLATFPGVGRRLERVGEVGQVVVYDDYGHHPAAIRATVAAVRQREPGRRVWAVYEPLTYHRTAAMLSAFAEAIATADAAAIADIWPGRDTDLTVASAEALAAAVATLRPDLTVAATGSVESTALWLAGRVRPGDVVLVMGGGRSYAIGPALLQVLTG
jgi:UDP-N-acetylmuramate--alanine ligase